MVKKIMKKEKTKTIKIPDNWKINRLSIIDDNKVGIWYKKKGVKGFFKPLVKMVTLSKNAKTMEVFKMGKTVVIKYF